MSTSPQTTIQSTQVESTQVWATNPDMVEVYLPPEFWTLADKCMLLMSEEAITKMIFNHCYGYEFYELKNADSADTDVISTGEEGQQYVPFEPEYYIDGFDISMNYSGEIEAVFYLKHSSDELRVSLGVLEQLRLKLKADASSTITV